MVDISYLTSAAVLLRGGLGGGCLLFESSPRLLISVLFISRVMAVDSVNYGGTSPTVPCLQKPLF